MSKQDLKNGTAANPAETAGKEVLAPANNLFGRTNQALRVAELYYRDHKSQKQIASAIQVSQATVSRLLDYGRESKLVHVTIHAPVNALLSQQVLGHLQPWGVREVIVAGYSRSHVGQAAADQIGELLRSRKQATLVIDGGMTIGEMITSLPRDLTTLIKVVPICADPPSYLVSAVELAAQLAAKCPFVENVKIPQFAGRALQKEHRKVQEIAAAADIVVLGVGPWKTTYTALEFIRHVGEVPQTVKQAHPDVLAVCGYCPITNRLELEHIPFLDERMPRSLSFSQMQALAQNSRCVVMLLAHSIKKCEAVLTAVRARLCNTLVVDEDLAKAILGDMAPQPGRRRRGTPRWARKGHAAAPLVRLQDTVVKKRGATSALRSEGRLKKRKN
jgi:DNA-binding transcriptional regulator LsrR (DeoR family)